MEVYIDRRVQKKIEDFYEASLKIHETLDEETVNNKIGRLYAALGRLSTHAMIHPKARLKKDWIEKDYYECLAEDFHFAYIVTQTMEGKDIVLVKDACHSLLYY